MLTLWRLDFNIQISGGHKLAGHGRIFVKRALFLNKLQLLKEHTLSQIKQAEE
jgi:hypothetical protein